MIDEIETRHLFYILDDHNVTVPAERETWFAWLREHHSDLALHTTTAGDCTVSTIFLFVDHASYGPPQLFESEIIGGRWHGDCERYATYADAAFGHGVQVLAAQGVGSSMIIAVRQHDDR